MAKARNSKQQDAMDDLEVLDWSGLIGYDEDFAKLTALHRSARLPQVILFEGREGIGKRRLMAWLAALIHCDTQSSCAGCGSCRSIMSRQHDEVLWLESDSTYKIADASLIQEHLSLQASGFPGFAAPAKRIVVLPDIEKMSDRVANRLLKTFEEPGQHALILLSSSRPRQLLPTILSRTVRWHLAPPPISAAVAWLQECLAEELGADEQWDELSLRQILKLHGLSPGESLKAVKARLAGDTTQLEAPLLALLKDPEAADFLQFAKDLARDQGRNVIELANHFELLLNRYYRYCLGLGDSRDQGVFQGFSSQPSIKRIQQWRLLLRRVRLVAGRGKVPLNAQLFVEALGLPDTKS